MLCFISSQIFHSYIYSELTYAATVNTLTISIWLSCYTHSHTSTISKNSPISRLVFCITLAVALVSVHRTPLRAHPHLVPCSNFFWLSHLRPSMKRVYKQLVTPFLVLCRFNCRSSVHSLNALAHNSSHISLFAFALAVHLYFSIIILYPYSATQFIVQFYFRCGVCPTTLSKHSQASLPSALFC